MRCAAGCPVVQNCNVDRSLQSRFLPRGTTTRCAPGKATELVARRLLDTDFVATHHPSAGLPFNRERKEQFKEIGERLRGIRSVAR